MSKILIVIPARYASTRLPGKPLIKINGVEMIARVAAIAQKVVSDNPESDYIVATDDDRIISFCQKNSIKVSNSSAHCSSGTERCYDILSRLKLKPELIINLQGDNPLCPPHVIQALIDSWKKTKAHVYTPYVHLSWEEYFNLVNTKEKTPYSGTTVMVDKDEIALCFSKAVLPVIRKLKEAQKALDKSPVRRHIGLYAYTYQALSDYFNKLKNSIYEESYIEGLEQMRFLENGYKIRMVEVDYQGRKTTSGVDSPEDIKRVEDILNEFGELSV